MVWNYFIVINTILFNMCSAESFDYSAFEALNN